MKRFDLDERRAYVTGALVGSALALVFAVVFAFGLDVWRSTNDHELRRAAAAEVELRVEAKKRELEICQTQLRNYREIADLADALERARGEK